MKKIIKILILKRNKQPQNKIKREHSKTNVLFSTGNKNE